MGLPHAPKVRLEPRPARARLEGGGEGTASMVCGALVIPSMLLTILPAMLALLFTVPDSGSNGLEWVSLAVFWSLPALFGLLSTLLGVLAVRRNQRDTTAWSTGVAGLCLAGVETSFFLGPAATAGFIEALT
jgi:hypothetical protein